MLTNQKQSNEDNKFIAFRALSRALDYNSTQSKSSRKVSVVASRKKRPRGATNRHKLTSKRKCP